MTGRAAIDTDAIRTRVGEVTVPVVLAVMTWVFVLLVVGRLLRFEGALSIVPLVFVTGLFVPLAMFAPWRNGVSERGLGWIAAHRRSLAVTAVFAGLLLLPVSDLLGPVVSFFQFPLRLTGMFYGATIPYRQYVVPELGTVLFRTSQWYVQLLWLFLLATGLVSIVDGIRGV